MILFYHIYMTSDQRDLREEMKGGVSVLTIFKVGFPGAILFMILRPMANIMDILEIR